MSAPKMNSKLRNVLQVIRRNPDAANDDMVLYEAYWREVDGWKPGDSMRFNTRPETISRRRRELYNLGLIEYREKANKAREEAYKNERERPMLMHRVVGEECAA